MEKFEKAIENYIEREENFALFVDGEWGTGKTYYLENTFLLNNLSVEENDRYDKKEVISVYGKESLKEIEKIVITRILNHIDSNQIKNKGLKGVSNILELFNIPYTNTESITGSLSEYLERKTLKDIEKNLNSGGNNFIIILDDIERLSVNISFKEFLGFIRNILLDSFNCKVILVGNKNILEKNGNEYKDYWEKVISRTLKFPSNLEVGKKMLNTDYMKNVFGEEVQDLVELINFTSQKEDRTNVLNLRTLNLIMTDFKNIFDQMEDANKQSTNVRMSLFTSLYILHNINRKNTLSEEEFKEFNVLTRLSFTKAKDDEEKSTKEILYNQYFKENEIVNKYAFLSSELKNYILEGVFDIALYQKQINYNFSEKNAGEDMLYILKNFYLYSEEKFESKLNEAIKILKDGEYAFSYRLNMYMRIKELSAKGIVSLEKKGLENLEEELLKNFELQISNSVSGDDLLKLNDFHFDSEVNLEGYKKELSDKMMKLQERYLEDNGVIDEYLQSILMEDRKKIGELEMTYKEIDVADIFKFFNTHIGYIEKELLEYNYKIIYLNRYIHNNNGMFIQQLDNIDNFIDNIKRIKEHSNDKIAIYSFNILESTLKKKRKKRADELED